MNVRARALAARIVLVVAAACLFLAALFAVLGRSFFRPGPFAARTAASLGDQGVATFVADRITSAIVAQKPDLIARQLLRRIEEIEDTIDHLGVPPPFPTRTPACASCAPSPAIA